MVLEKVQFLMLCVRQKGDIVDDIVQATLFNKEDMAFVDTQCIHVFNEDYVSSRVKIRDDGLNAIFFWVS